MLSEEEAEIVNHILSDEKTLNEMFELYYGESNEDEILRKIKDITKESFPSSYDKVNWRSITDEIEAQIIGDEE